MSLSTGLAGPAHVVTNCCILAVLRGATIGAAEAYWQTLSNEADAPALRSMIHPEGRHSTMTMQRYVALVRGINVGRAKRVAMADLRKLVSDLGYADVRSLLNSGNIVFSAARLAPAEAATAIEDALVLKLGVAARVMVLSSTELAAIVSDNSLLALADDHARLMVFVIADASLHEHVAGLCERDEHGLMALGRHAAYVWCPTGVLDSAHAAAMGKLLGDSTTARNWNTVTKLHQLCFDPA
jgi:uncharacterized protein (DUF1697 family)